MSDKLVLYFSVYGTARAVAKEIARQTGADIAEIKPAVPYDNDRTHYNALAKLAKKEHDEDMRPAIAWTLPVAEHETIYIGYPMWWYTFPMIIYTLFDQYDFSGKMILPLCTNEGIGMGSSERDIKRACPDANVKSGLPITGSNAANSESGVKRWLTANGLM